MCLEVLYQYSRGETEDPWKGSKL